MSWHIQVGQTLLNEKIGQWQLTIQSDELESQQSSVGHGLPLFHRQLIVLYAGLGLQITQADSSYRWS